MLLDRTKLMHDEAVKAAQEKEKTAVDVDKAKFGLQGRIFSEWQDDAASASALVKELKCS